MIIVVIIIIISHYMATAVLSYPLLSPSVDLYDSIYLPHEPETSGEANGACNNKYLKQVGEY